ncbi:quinon protein alcohol dehydrogenase-like superfamily [Blakeslea trispora]|nr:quinon protein alcohol dehydrogenase-like superfamily [Blakeslea trispora]
MSFDQTNLQYSRDNTHPEIPTKDQDNLNYSKTIQNDVPSKGKKKSHYSKAHSDEPCHIGRLSVEVLMHIFARLDPASLAIVARVCHYWRYVVTNNGCWRDAFVAYFGCLPFKRLTTESWKTEYILRTHLSRKWTKARGTVMTFNPKIGSLEAMHISFEDSHMAVSSHEQGVAIRCNAVTGKMDQRHPFYSTNENIRIPVTATEMDQDRILWGFDAGFITLSLRKKPINNRLIVFSDFHQSPVCLLCLPKHRQDVVASGAEDGTIKLWDVSTASCALTLRRPVSTARVPTCIKLTLDHYVIIGYNDGSVAIWQVNLHELLGLTKSQGENSENEKRDWLDRLEQSKRLIPPPSSRNYDLSSVKHLSYDSDTHAVVVSYSGVSEIYKYDVTTGRCTAIFGHGHSQSSSITCIKWDKTLPSALLSLDSALKTRTAGASKRRGGTMIHLSGTSTTPSSSSASSPPVTPDAYQSSVKTTRLLATGDDLGTLCLWDGDEVDQLEEGRIIRPLRVFSGGHITAISCIYLDAFKLVSGSDDGWIRVWDPLTGKNLCTLGNKIPKHAPVDRTDVDVMRVKTLWCSNDYRGVATIGHQIKVWDFSPDKQFLARPLKPKGSGKPVIRDRLRYEIDCEVKESMAKMASERLEREQAEKNYDRLALEGLSEEEMVHYAMLLSQQEKPVKESLDDFVDVDDEDLMKAVIASLDNHRIETPSVSSEPSESSVSLHDEVWPTIADNSTEDEELRYILELSKTEK